MFITEKKRNTSTGTLTPIPPEEDSVSSSVGNSTPTTDGQNSQSFEDSKFASVHSTNSTVTIKPSPLVKTPSSNRSSQHPRSWSVEQVSQFLLENDCGRYADAFVKKVKSFATSEYLLFKYLTEFLKNYRFWSKL